MKLPAYKAGYSSSFFIKQNSKKGGGKFGLLCRAYWRFIRWPIFRWSLDFHCSSYRFGVGLLIDRKLMHK
ncbi:MAG: hypothetical protein L0922_07330, partial [Candidatus Mariimomonas ferrooxydans]